jgi:pyruvate kinase
MYQESNIHLSKSKRTKIIVTVGPATNSYDAIFELIKAGANGLRLNFSHGTHEEHKQLIHWIRKAAKEQKELVAIIQDLQGPKIRLGDFDGVFTVQKGQNLTFKYNTDFRRSGYLPTQYDLSKIVKRGERIMLYDGNIKATVTSVKDGNVHAIAENDGVLIKRKGINLPDTDFGGDIITNKDKEDAVFGSTHDIDYVAMSFVQTANDIKSLRKILTNLGSKSKIIAKIETSAALENIEEIVKEADAVMVARGDLAIETKPEAVPVMQRKIIGLGQLYSTPTIVATQMMISMTEAPEPTRAEVSDVATAVMVAADCVMLSDETANGKYPIKSVKIMDRVIHYTEDNSPLHVIFNKHQDDYDKQSAICHTVIELANKLKATAIVAETKSGATALQVASWRPNLSIIAVTSDERVAQQLAICYGTKSYVRADSKAVGYKQTNWLEKNRILKKGDIIVSASGLHPGVVGTTDTIKVRVL